MVAILGTAARPRPSGSAALKAPAGAPACRPGPRGSAVAPVVGWRRVASECAWLTAVGACAFVVVFLFGLLALDSAERPVPDATALVRLGHGDTLAGVAARFAPDSDQDEVVRRIVELNRLGAASPASGSSLLVPVQRG